MDIASYFFTPLGFLLFELLRLYKRKIKGEEAFPKDMEYYILMTVLLLVVLLISYGIQIQPIIAALLFGFTLPSGLETAFQTVGLSKRGKKIDDLTPHVKLPAYKRIIVRMLNRYFRV